MTQRNFIKCRIIEAVCSMALAALLVGLMLMLSGCQALQKERQKYLEPEQLPAYKAHFQSEYSQAAKAAQENPSPKTIAAYVDAGSALLATNCHYWVQINTLASRGLIVDSQTLSLINGAATTLAGIASATPGFVAALGVAQVAVSGMNANLQENIMGIPAQYSVQTAILKAQAQCVDDLLVKTPTTFAGAYRGLLACERTCSFGAAADMTTKALQGAK